MRTYWGDSKAAGDAGTEKYNAITNSCDDKIAGPLNAGGQDIRAFTGVPTLTGEFLKAQGREIKPSD